jgi:hypothetical protein
MRQRPAGPVEASPRRQSRAGHLGSGQRLAVEEAQLTRGDCSQDVPPGCPLSDQSQSGIAAGGLHFRESSSVHYEDG